MYEFCMPYMIQLISELKTRVEIVHKKNEDREKKDEQQTKEKLNQPLNFVAHDLDMMMPTQPMLPGPGMVPPGMYASTPGFPPAPGAFGTGNYRGF